MQMARKKHKALHITSKGKVDSGLSSSRDIVYFRENQAGRKLTLYLKKGEEVLDAHGLNQASPTMESSRFSGTNWFSSYRRYVNVFGWIYRYARNLLSEHIILDPKLTEDERQYREKLLLRSIQKS